MEEGRIFNLFCLLNSTLTLSPPRTRTLSRPAARGRSRPPRACKSCGTSRAAAAPSTSEPPMGRYGTGREGMSVSRRPAPTATEPPRPPRCRSATSAARAAALRDVSWKCQCICFVAGSVDVSVDMSVDVPRPCRWMMDLCIRSQTLWLVADNMAHFLKQCIGGVSEVSWRSKVPRTGPQLLRDRPRPLLPLGGSEGRGKSRPCRHRRGEVAFELEPTLACAQIGAVQ